MNKIISELLNNVYARINQETDILSIESTFQPWGW